MSDAAEVVPWYAEGKSSGEDSMRILIADNQYTARRALRLLLNQAGPFQIVGEAADAPNLLARIVTTTADLVLLDGNLPGLPMVELLSVLRRAFSKIRVIILSTQPEAGPAALAAGADAFVSKTASKEHLLAAIEACHRVAQNEHGAPEDATVLSLETGGGNDGSARHTLDKSRFEHNAGPRQTIGPGSPGIRRQHQSIPGGTSNCAPPGCDLRRGHVMVLS
jgi:DNA-binding response OmpR family regulator